MVAALRVALVAVTAVTLSFLTLPVAATVDVGPRELS
jgi:hypothetical protein